MFSNPLSNTYMGREEVNGSVLGLVRQILGIQHLTMRPEVVLTVFCTSPFEVVGCEPRWGKYGLSKCVTPTFYKNKILST
jgi:hypothetical protein